MSVEKSEINMPTALEEEVSKEAAIVESREAENKKTEFMEEPNDESEEENLIDEAYPIEDPRRWIKLVESESNSAIKQYFNNLGLTNKMLSEKKKVLDVGADMGDFAAFCLREKISDKVISLDPVLENNPETGIMDAVKIYWGEEIYSQIRNKTVAGVMEKIPFRDKSFDLIVDHAAFPGFNCAFNEVEKMKDDVDKAFNEIIRVLKSGGEARLFPLADESSNEKWSQWRPIIDKKLAEIVSQGKCSIFIEDVIEPETGELMNEKRLILKKSIIEIDA